MIRDIKMAGAIAQVGGRFFGGWTLFEICKYIIVIAAVLGVLYIVLQVLGITIPPWLIKVGVILAAAFIGILAIGLLLSM